MKIILALALVVSFSLIGCATAISGKTQRIKINSNPPGATVHITNTCQPGALITVETPAEVKLERSQMYHVRAQKEGYLPVNTGLGHKANNNVFLNLIWVAAHGEGGALALLGSLFIGVDHYYGTIWTLEPKEINIELIEDKTGS